jgi:hypothetical protein
MYYANKALEADARRSAQEDGKLLRFAAELDPQEQAKRKQQEQKRERGMGLGR